MGWIETKYNGKCLGCTKFVQARSMASYEGGKIVACQNCQPTAAGVRGKATGNATKAPYKHRRVALETVTPEVAQKNLALQLSVLDAEQRLVADWTPADGNLRIVACAGAGKTTTLKATVANLLRSGTPPENVIVTTFTRKAADELRERCAQVIPAGVIERLRIGTFHSLALRGLKAQGLAATLVDDRNLDARSGRAPGIPTSTMLWEQVLGTGPIAGTAEVGLGLPRHCDPKTYAQAADCLRANGHEPFVETTKAALDLVPLTGFALAWETYYKAKATLSAWDFADVLAKYLDSLRLGVIEDYGNIVFVDEAQDNSVVQIEIAKQLGYGKGRIVFVGDQKQAIYAWRGASPELFGAADKDLGAKTLQIRSNYRSGKAIVALGNSIAAGKSWNLGDPARAARANAGTITIQGSETPATLATQIAANIRSLGTDGGEALKEIAVLSRTNAALGQMEVALVRAKIPCVVVGGSGFFARRDVQDFIALVKLSMNDDTDSFSRLVKRTFSLGAAYARDVLSAAGTLLEAIAAVGPTLRDSRRRAASEELLGTLRKIRAAGWPDCCEIAAAYLTPPDSMRKDSEDAEEKATAAVTISTIAREFATMQEFCDFAERSQNDVSTVGENDAAPEGRVTLSTVHRAKGREWSRVFVLASEGTFPHARSADDPKRQEEEERLFYVAVTRAKNDLVLCYSETALNGMDAGPSSFFQYVAGQEDGPENEPPTGGGEEAPQAPAEAPAASPAPAVAPAVAAPTIPLPPMPVRDPLPPMPAQAAPALSEVRWSPGACARQLLQALPQAERLTAQAPAPMAGEKFVAVGNEEMLALLAPLAFVRGSSVLEYSANQQLWDLTAGPVVIRVYSSVALDGSAREVGEDSIKVAVLHGGKPLSRKQPYAARTKNWRMTLLRKIAEALSTISELRCPKCDGLMSVRLNKIKDTEFYGCSAYPTCAGTRPVMV